MRSAHSMARRCPHEGHRPRLLTRERDDFLVLLGALGVDAADAREAEVEVAAADEGLEEMLDPGVERAVGVAEAVVPDAEELLHGVFHDVLEVVGGRSGAVAVERGGERGQAGAGG